MPTVPTTRRGRHPTTTDTAHQRPAATRSAGPAHPGTLLTVAEVLGELQVARSTFDAWRALGTAPECIKLPNGQLRIRRTALDAWLASHVQAPAEAC